MDEECSPDPERGAAFRAALAAWDEEVDRLNAQIRDDCTAVLTRLEDCRSPMDVLSVERVWLSVRSRAYVDSSLRFAHAFGQIARALYADHPRA